MKTGFCSFTALFHTRDEQAEEYADNIGAAYGELLDGLIRKRMEQFIDGLQGG